MNHLTTTPNPLRILIVRSSSIGDVVLATSAVSTSKNWENITGIPLELHWAGQEPSLSLIRNYLPGVTAHDLSKPGTIPDHFDGCLDLQGNLRSLRLTIELASRSRVRIVRSHKKYASRLFMISTSRLFGRSSLSLSMQRWFAGPGGARHANSQWGIAAAAMNQLLAGMDQGRVVPGKLDTAARPRLFCPAGPELLDPQCRWLAVAPGAAHPAKKAPASLFAATLSSLARMLPDGQAARTGLVLLGAGPEKADCTELARQLKGGEPSPTGTSRSPWPGPVLDLSGQTDLCGTVPLLNACAAVLSNDSSLAHIAEAIDKPAFVFFGPTVEAFGFAPHLARSKTYSTSLGCRPCSKHGKAACRYGDHLCFNSIPHLEVSRDLRQILVDIDS